MASMLTMPRLSDTMTTGKILSWTKKVGDRIAPGDVLAEIESDKAAMEYESFEEGILLEIRVPAGESAPVGAILGVLGEAGEAIPASEPVKKEPAVEKSEAKKSKTEKNVAAPKPSAPTVEPLRAAPVPVLSAPKPVTSVSSDRKLFVSPVAMRLAAELGVDLRSVTGSGPDGRIVRVDVEAAVGKTPVLSTAIAQTPGVVTQYIPKLTTTGKLQPLSQMRTAIARRMSEGWMAPMFTVTVTVDSGRLSDLRAQLKEIDGNDAPSINDFIVAACARALRSYPTVNAAYAGDSIQLHEQQDIAIAVALDDGLITPVIRNAGTLTLREIGRVSRDLSLRARTKKLQPEEFTGSTFTISNLGMFDVDHFTAIVNPPEAAILAVGSIQDVAAVVKGQICIAKRMTLTLSGDHRVIDGATGAKFLSEVKKLLELPASLM